MHRAPKFWAMHISESVGGQGNPILAFSSLDKNDNPGSPSWWSGSSPREERQEEGEEQVFGKQSCEGRFAKTSRKASNKVEEPREGDGETEKLGWLLEGQEYGEKNTKYAETHEGWHQFEEICIMVSGENLGIGVSSTENKESFCFLGLPLEVPLGHWFFF